MTRPVRTILMVDDDDDFLLQQSLPLIARGYRVVTASSGAQARASLAGGRPDLVVCDLMMEDVDAGFALAHHVKRTYPGLPVILVTAVTGQTGIEFPAELDRDRSWNKADAVLAKPVRPEQLLREIERLAP